jgi:hypothetical protein
MMKSVCRCSRKIALVLALVFLPQAARAGVVFGLTGATLGGGSRWDAAPRVVNLSGQPFERSLNGGLRFSLEGGSYQAFRDMFTWQGGTPSLPAFQSAVDQAFAAWSSPDPASLLTTQVSFAADFATPVLGSAVQGAADSRGAEIDILATTDALFWNPGNNNPQAETWFNAVGGPVTLTSGTAGYSGFAISGADILLNNNPGAVYSLDFFRRLLTHEIGHAIGLGDIEGDINPGAFIDDNFSAANSAAVLATTGNSWAGLVNTANPAASPLARYTIPFGDPGTTTPGVDILMESRGLGIGANNPLASLVPLTNDDYGTRQFLYPSTVRVPEPASALLLLAGAAGALAWARSRSATGGARPPAGR